MDRYAGCLLGLALGDAMGAPYEGGPLERAAWRILGKTLQGRMRWTDDTQMSLDLADSLLAHRRVDQDDIAARFATSYRWSRGYGHGAAKTLRRIRRGEAWATASRAVYADGSMGNGAAMRAPVVALMNHDNLEALDADTRATAVVTHGHVDAQVGAVLIARATAAALHGDDILASVAQLGSHEAYATRLQVARDWLDASDDVDLAAVSQTLGHGVLALESTVTALYIALRHMDAPFAQLVRTCSALGGDVDTIAAMAGAIWGAAHGAARLPTADLDRLEGVSRIRRTAVDLYDAFGSPDRPRSPP